MTAVLAARQIRDLLTALHSWGAGIRRGEIVAASSGSFALRAAFCGIAGVPIVRRSDVCAGREIPDDFQVSAFPESTAITEPNGQLANGNLASLDVPYPMLSEVAPAANITQNSNDASGINDRTVSSKPTFHWLPMVAHWMTILYAAGVFFFLIRLGTVLRGGQRLRAISRPMCDSVLLKLVRDSGETRRSANRASGCIL